MLWLFGGRFLCGLLRGLLLLGLVRKVMTDRTAGDGAKHRVMVGKMSGDRADCGAFEASRPGRHGRCDKRKRCYEGNGKTSHSAPPSATPSTLGVFGARIKS